MRHIKPSSMWVSLGVILPLFWKGVTSQDTYPPGYSILVSSSVSVHEGLGVAIPCTFTADNRKTFRNSFGFWIQTTCNLNDIVATNDKSNGVKKTNFHLTGNPDSGDCTLTIADARKEDAGTYFFRFEESKTSRVKYSFTREVTTTITVDFTCITITSEINGEKQKKQDSIKVDEGSSVILRCSVQSKLELNVTWMDGKNKVLRPGTKKERELRLENMTMNHTGTYTCSALTDRVINSTNIIISVQYPPRNMDITIQSSKGGELPASPQVVINKTETLTLICRADGDPPVTVVWEKAEVNTEANKESISELSAVINVTSSMADVYRCVAWNALGLRERHIKVIKQGSTDASSTIDEISYQDISIAFICGMSITALIILLYKLITWKKNSRHKMYAENKEQSDKVEQPANEIYMNVSKPKRKAEVHEEPTGNNIQLDSSGATSNQDDLHYSTIAFTAKPSKAPSCQPETEYADIQVK